MTVQVETFAEWARFADEVDEPRAQAIGALADQVRARLGANKHVPVWFSEEIESMQRDCDCCGSDLAARLVIECGDERARISLPYYTADAHDALPDFLSWLDEPRRVAEREAERARVREREAVVAAAVVSAFSRVQVDPSSPDWHSDMLRQLGIPE